MLVCGLLFLSQILKTCYFEIITDVFAVNMVVCLFVYISLLRSASYLFVFPHCPLSAIHAHRHSIELT